MTKNLTLLLLSLLLFQVTRAQNSSDTLSYFMRNKGLLVSTKDSADYVMLIMPIDSAAHLSAIKQYYKNGKVKLIGMSSSRKYSKLSYEGLCKTYYPNGNIEEEVTYKNGSLIGKIMSYYPNGSTYIVSFIDKDGRQKLIECRDNTGLLITKNGNGKWIYYDDKFKYINLRGEVKDSLKTGEWDSMDGNRIQTTCIFEKGKFISGVYINKSGNKTNYYQDEVEPMFEGGSTAFSNFLAKNVKYPKYDKDNKIEGKVTVTFVVEKDGTITDVKSLRAPDQYLGDAAVKVIQMSPPWSPGIQNGQPVRVQYTVSFAFKL